MGHVQLLAGCRKIAGPDGTVVVALNPDDFVLKFKGVQPTMSVAERKAVLLSCKYVDEVIINNGWQDSTKTIEAYGPVDFVAIGDDWAPPKDYYGQMGFTKQWLEDNDITLIYIDRNTGMSSTTIRQRLKHRPEITHPQSV
jgi:glycerol-3-phosphate cytidylyltransferase-like family protein